MKLEPGYYKVQRSQPIVYGAKPRTNGNPIHILRVVGIGDKQMIYFDQDVIGRLTKDFEDLKDYDILSRYDREPVIGNAHFIISFQDASGVRFDWKVKDAWTLRNVFDANPYLKEVFNYGKKSKK